MIFGKIKDFKEVFNKGKKFKTTVSQIVYLIEVTSNQEPTFQYAVMALKKVIGKKAVHRNKAKRRFKHGFITCMKSANWEKGYNVKMIALTNKNILTCEWGLLIQDIEKSLKIINQEILLLKRN